MSSLDRYMDERLAHGRSYFAKPEAMDALGLTSRKFLAAAERLVKRQRLAKPRLGFYLILRPEDRITGAPDPARWIDPLMKHLGLPYRVSLLRAAAFHGSSHQAAMVFQVVVPKQTRPISLGRHRIQFIHQASSAFHKANQPDWLDAIKTEAGYATVAGVELTLLDCARYLRQAAGINGVAQVVHDLGAKARPRQLAKAAGAYENSVVRRLGFLLDHFGHRRQADALLPYAAKAKSLKPLDPSVRTLGALSSRTQDSDPKWKLVLNEPVEIDA
jgi:predicted transcriptional regulator of viral defense system